MQWCSPCEYSEGESGVPIRRHAATLPRLREPKMRWEIFHVRRSSVTANIPLEGREKKDAQSTNARGYEDYTSARKSYSSITAATANRLAGAPPSTRTTRPLQRTRMLSVSVISGGRVRVKSIAEPAWMAEST